MTVTESALLERCVEAFNPPISASNKSLRLNLAISGGPIGDFESFWQFDAGKLSAQPASGADAEAALSLAWKDATAIVAGELEPAVAFMQGRLKSTGDNGVVIRLLKASTTPEFKAWLERVALSEG